MGEYVTGVCTPWITVDEFLSCHNTVDENLSIERIETAISIASNTLYYMSGSIFPGTCTKTVTVCRENCRNTRLADHCDYENEIEIGYFPITKLISIKFDDIEQLPDRDPDTDEFVTDPNFQINEFRFIEKLDGKWPVQSGEEMQEVIITFEHGAKPPIDGMEAVKALASEIFDSLSQKDCSISDRASHIVRRGVTITTKDYKLLAEDFLGIFLVDIFLQAVNPTKARIPSFVVQPGRTARTRRKDT
jgi:hypothetical protein